MSLQTISQKRKTFAQEMLTEGEPMLMRLLPPYKIDKATGKKLPDTIVDGIGYLKKRKWYANFYNKNKHVGVSLDAYEPEQRKAIENLKLVFEDLQSGRMPNGSRTKFIKLQPERPFELKYQQIRAKHIDPFFGEYKLSELTQGLMEQYIEQRWGRDHEGNLQCAPSSFKDSMVILRVLISRVDENYNLYNRILKSIKYVALHKDLLPPLTEEQIHLVWETGKKHQSKMGMGENFKKGFWVMVYTGMEAKDICELCPKHFVQIKDQEWLIKGRSKTKLNKNSTQIKIPVLPQLKEILSELPTPIDKNTPYFPTMLNSELNKTIIKWFARTEEMVNGEKVSLKGYGAKYLRRYLGELALDLGQTENWVQQALGHAFDSKVTKRYMRVREGTMLDVFNKIAKRA